MTWKRLSEWFWTSEFWLPKNVSWSDIQTTRDTTFPDFQDPWIYPFGIAALYFAFKYIVISPIFIQIARRNGIKRNHALPRPSLLLEKLYKENGGEIPKPLRIELAKKLGWTEHSVNKWIYKYKKQLKPSPERRFVEIGFQFVHHSVYGIMGFCVLWNKPWMWNLEECFHEYPLHPLTDDIWWYYMIPLGFFWNLLINQLFLEPLRKDTFLDMTHHIISILLMSFSWITNHVRVGAVVLFSHHIVDGFLLGGKLILKLNMKEYVNAAFVVIFIVWIATRLIYFPFWVVPIILYKFPEEKAAPVVFFFNILIQLLQVLNVVWTVMLVKIAYLSLSTGEVKDVRSSDESEEDLQPKKQ